MGLTGLRLTLVGPLPPPAGGMATQTAQLKRLLEGEGVQVELVQTNAPYWPTWFGRVPMVRALARLLPYLGALWRACGRAHVVHLMANSGWSWHLFAAPAIAIARLRGVPVLVNYRGGEAEGFLARSRGIVGLSLNRVQALVVPSGFLVEVFARFGWKAEVVPNVVDLSLFHPGPTRPNGHHLVVTRNLEVLYDNASAIRALATLRQSYPDTHLTVAGSGPQRAELEELVVELGLGDAVQFTGRLDRQALAELLRSADVLLNPSLADNMPNSLLEALATGVPVVSTHVGGVPFMVEHGRSAWLVPPQDPAALAAAVQELFDNDALRQSLRATGLLEAQRYTWQQVAPRLAEAYRQAMR